MSDLSRPERETGILWNDADDSAILWTLSPSTKARLEKRLGAPAFLDPNGSWSWIIPKSWVRISKSRKASPAQKAHLSKLHQDRAKP